MSTADRQPDLGGGVVGDRDEIGGDLLPGPIGGQPDAGGGEVDPANPERVEEPQELPGRLRPEHDGVPPGERVATRCFEPSAWCRTRSADPRTSSRSADRPMSTQCALPSATVVVSVPLASVADLDADVPPGMLTTACCVTARPIHPGGARPHGPRGVHRGPGKSASRAVVESQHVVAPPPGGSRMVAGIRDRHAAHGGALCTDALGGLRCLPGGAREIGDVARRATPGVPVRPQP